MLAKILVAVTAAALLTTGGYLYFNHHEESNGCNGSGCSNTPSCSTPENSCTLTPSLGTGCCAHMEATTEAVEDLPMPREVQ